MIYASTIVLERCDLKEESKELAFELIDFYDFHYAEGKRTVSVSLVLFVDVDQKSKILKNRYGKSWSIRFRKV